MSLSLKCNGFAILDFNLTKEILMFFDFDFCYPHLISDSSKHLGPVLLFLAEVLRHAEDSTISIANTGAGCWSL
jgi:hypothetical protein